MEAFLLLILISCGQQPSQTDMLDIDKGETYRACRKAISLCSLNNDIRHCVKNKRWQWVSE
jgi:hypothetical protein